MYCRLHVVQPGGGKGVPEPGGADSRGPGFPTGPREENMKPAGLFPGLRVPLGPGEHHGRQGVLGGPQDGPEGPLSGPGGPEEPQGGPGVLGGPQGRPGGLHEGQDGSQGAGLQDKGNGTRIRRRTC